MLAVTIAGCGGSSARSNVPPLPGSSATPIPGATPTPPAGSHTAAVTAAAAALHKYWSGLPHQDRSVDAAAVATYMKSSSMFHNVDVSDGDVVFAQLPDGSHYAYFLDLGGPYPGATTTSHARSREPRTSQRRRASTATSYVMPDPTGRVAIFTDDVSFPIGASTESISFVNAFNSAGYKNVGWQQFSVPNALALKGTPLSVLFIHAHGGNFDGILGVGRPFFGMMTSTPVSPENDKLYAGMITAATGHDDDQLGTAQAAGSPTPYYLLLTPFFSANITFGANALVYLTSCHSAAPGPGTQGFIHALQSAGPNVVYVGWTKSPDGTDGDETSAFVFDRMFGETESKQFLGPPNQESPPERPFALEEVLAYGATRGRDDGHSSTETTSCVLNNVIVPPLLDGCVSNLVEFNPGSASMLLVPSIAHMQVDEASGILTVLGEFPGATGSFAVYPEPPQTPGGATTIAASAWSPTSATAPIPPSGPAAAGYIVARAMGVSGNAAPLTMWKGLKVKTGGTRTGPNYSDSFTLNGSYDFRADIHPYRSAPGAAPTLPPNQTNSWVMNTSTTHLSGKSTIFIVGLGNDPGQTGTMTLNADPAWCELQSGNSACPGTNGFYGALWDPCPVAPTTGLCLEVFGFAAGNDSWTPGPSTCQNPGCAVSLEFNAETPGLTIIPLPLDTGSNILMTAPPNGNCYDPFYGTGPQDKLTCTLTSTAVTASFPPASTTPQ